MRRETLEVMFWRRAATVLFLYMMQQYCRKHFYRTNFPQFVLKTLFPLQERFNYFKFLKIKQCSCRVGAQLYLGGYQCSTFTCRVDGICEAHAIMKREYCHLYHVTRVIKNLVRSIRYLLDNTDIGILASVEIQARERYAKTYNLTTDYGHTVWLQYLSSLASDYYIVKGVLLRHGETPASESDNSSSDNTNNNNSEEVFVNDDNNDDDDVRSNNASDSNWDTSSGNLSIISEQEVWDEQRRIDAIREKEEGESKTQDSGTTSPHKDENWGSDRKSSVTNVITVDEFWEIPHSVKSEVTLRRNKDLPLAYQKLKEIFNK